MLEDQSTKTHEEIDKFFVEEGTSLHTAIHENKDVQSIIALLKAGYDVEQENATGDTLLIVAVQAASVEIVKELLKRKVDVNKHSRQGYSALDYAVTTLRSLLIYWEKSENIAADYKNIKKLEKIVCFLLKNGANFDETSYSMLECIVERLKAPNFLSFSANSVDLNASSSTLRS